MPDFIPLIRIFLSSPGDVGEERRLALRVIRELPNRHVFRNRLKLAAIAWDDLASSTPLEASLTPQEAINQGLPQPKDCDITIVMFWSRMGTPFTHTDGIEYKSGTHWELLNALDSSSRTYIYRRDQEPDLGNVDNPDYDRNLNQYRRLKSFLSSDLFYSEDGQILRSIQEYDSPDDFEKRFALDLEKILLDVLKNIEQSPTSVHSRSEDLPQTENIQIAETVEWPANKSPFPGLRAFTEEDADIFYGRGRETDLLVQQVRDSQFVAVVGASGSGKSSLVGAGLIPRLRKNAIEGSKDWHFVKFTPGDNPFDGLYEAMIEVFPQFKPNTMEKRRIKQNFIADMRETPETLLDICADGLSSSPVWAQVLLFVDQFEELFTLTNPDDAAIFADLLTLIASSERLRAIVTMRHDFFNKAVENQTLAELLRADSVFALSTPKRDALREMIERPAERAELRLESGLVTRILDDTGNEPGNLALMAYALDELYKLDDDQHLTHVDYMQLGGVQGAIGVRAHNIFEELSEETREKFLPLFRHLISITPDGTPTRRRALLSNLRLNAQLEEAVDKFINARLLIQYLRQLCDEIIMRMSSDATEAG